MKDETKKAAKPAGDAIKTDGVKVEADRSKYQTCRSATGAKSLHSGDVVATACEGVTLVEMFELTTKFCGEDYKAKYGHLNGGMQRMNLGNRIRGKIGSINKSNEKALAAVKEGDKQPNVISGEDRFTKAVAPFVKARDTRAKTAAKEAEAKAKQKTADAEAKAKSKAKKDEAKKPAVAKAS